MQGGGSSIQGHLHCEWAQAIFTQPTSLLLGQLQTSIPEVKEAPTSLSFMERASQRKKGSEGPRPRGAEEEGDFLDPGKANVSWH